MSRTRVRAWRSVAVLAAVSLLGVISIQGVAGAGGGSVDKKAVLRVGVPVEGNGGVYFDPAGPKAAAQSPSNRLWNDLIYDTFIHNTPDGKGEPGLATKWTTPDPNTVELTLRKGVKFSDGTPFNAEAVKAGLDRTLGSGRPNLTPNLLALESIEVVNDNTIRIHLSEPIAQAYIDDELRNSNAMAVVSPAAVAAGTDLDAEPVGAGPYVLEEYTTGKVTLAKNPTFYDKKAQKLAGVEFSDVAVGPPSVSALQSDTVDLVWQVPPDAIEQLEAGPDTAVSILPSERQFTLNLCVSDGPFASKEARQAVQWAIDRDSINEAALAGTGPPNVTVLTPKSPFFDKSKSDTYSYNPKKAKALLKKAGLEEGTTVTAVVPAQAPYETIAEIVQSNFEDVGLNLEITKTSNFAADAQAAKPDLLPVSLQPTLYSLSLGGQTTVLNNCGYANPEVIAAVAVTQDGSKTQEEKQAVWDTIQEILLDETPLVFTNLDGINAAHSTKVQGVDVINAPYGPQINRISVTK
jgi:peptide/nickel transport system substrate-binding protein